MRERLLEATVACLVEYGYTGTTVTRIAERVGADLLVVGHKPRTQAMRLLLGDTADAVARRSRASRNTSESEGTSANASAAAANSPAFSCIRAA